MTSASLINGKVELNGYVAGVERDGGTCRFDLVADGRTLSMSSTSRADATTTACPGVSIPAPVGDPSTWVAHLVWEPNGAVSESLHVTTTAG